MNEVTERVLLEALDLLEQGVGVDEILARHPDYATELRPFLLTASRLNRLASQPTVAAQAQSRRAFLAAATEVRGTAPSPRAALRRWLAPVMGLVLVALLAGSALTGASGAALPGDALYDSKRWLEETRLGLSGGEQAAGLQEQFRQRRLAEVSALLDAGREADVSIRGYITAIDGLRLTVEGLPVALSEATRIEGAPVVGSLVEIDGRTTRGALVAEAMRVISGLLPDDQPTPQPSATLAPPATDTPATPTIRPSDTPAPTWSTSPTPLPTPPPTPESPAPAPTEAPPVNDNDNDDGANDNADDGGANDNGDDGGANDNADDGGANDNDNDDGANDNADDGGANDNDDGNGNDDSGDNDGDSDNDNQDNSGSDNDDDGDDNDGGGDNNDDAGDDGGGNGNDDDNGGD